MTGEWTPEFPGQRPPFQPGHTLSMRHGAYSERRIGPLAEQLAADLLADPTTPDYLREARFAGAVLAWARAEAVVRLYLAWLDAQDLDKPARGALAVLEALRKAEAAAATARSRLGLDPVSRAKLARDLATAGFMSRGGAEPLAAVAEVGRAALERARAAGALPGEVDDQDAIDETGDGRG